MKRRLTTIGLALIAVTTLSAAGHDRPRTSLFDNFNDGNADGWDQNDFTVDSPGGPGIYRVANGRYVLESTGAIPVDDPSVGTIESHWEATADSPKFANATVRGILRANTYGTTIGFTVRDNDEAETGYDFCASTSFGTFYIDRYDLGANPAAPQTIIAMADPRWFRFVPGESWNVEAGFVGSLLWMKFWKVGHREPLLPTLVVVDKGLPPSSGSEIAVVVFFDPEPLIAYGVDAVRVSGAFDDISVTPAARR